ncbi:hypothetical protein EVG20_g3639 [Dentipellis fragilis]|uniref:Cytochrome b561 domain-containing protein n=1 Tax=Dentipellis fragilis TaxID=205917 RepID=A0A4Y9Z2V7_9AGAM|nr:hypothetical protein EVG20_g3639 [Dentipellis fragilis]
MMGQEERYLKPEGRTGDSVALYTAITSAGVLFLFTWIIVLNNDPMSMGWFALHPTLQTLAILSFVVGILTLQPTSQPKTKAAGLQRHQLAMIIGLPSVTVGTLSIVWNKLLHESKHFTTWHGIFGIISLAWLVAQFALGAGSVWFDGALFGGGLKAKQLWKYHRLSGYVLLPLVLITTNFGGAWSNWAVGHSAYGVRFIAFTLAPLVLLASLYIRIRPSKMKFF